MKGSVFVQQISTLPRLPDRENAIEKAVREGHSVPWPLVDVSVQAGDSVLAIRVSADYLAIGEPDDFVRVPLSPLAAQRICDMFDATLPTARLSDLIWKAADIRLTPQPMGPPYDGSMLTVARFAEHDKRVETQRAGRTGLIAGHKKDVVLSQRLASRPNQVAIYGWHRPSGVAIQPVSLIHENTYADYSHGVRLIGKTAYLDGSPVSLESILRSEEMASAISGEGPLSVLRVPGVPAPWVKPDDDGKPLGLRALDIAQAELAKPGWESPPGSFGGPRIAQYFAGCTRKGKPLGISSGNWCAAFASFCENRALHQGEDGPHGYRAAVSELWADAVQTGAARRMSSSYRPRVGDLALFGRNGQDPTKGGVGHVGRVVREVDGAGTFETIEGNHQNRVMRVTRTLTETVGFIAYPQADSEIVIPTEEDLDVGAGVVPEKPTDDVPPPEGAPQRLPADMTVVTEMELYKALEKGWIKLWGDKPHRTSLLVLLAHWALETGRGKSMHAYNLGNIKSRVGDGHDYTYFACNELINGKWVWFYPDAAGCRFRAYKTLDLGVEDYLTLIRKRFDKSWVAVLAGSPADFCHLLRVQRYYTADEASYTAAVVSIYNEYSRLLPTGGLGVDLGTTRGIQEALRTLGYDPGPVNGQLGAKLTAAIKAFQLAHRLSVDGIVGPITRGALAAELAAKVEADAPPSPVAPDEPGPAFLPDGGMESGPPDCLVLLPEILEAEAARAASEGGNQAAV